MTAPNKGGGYGPRLFFCQHAFKPRGNARLRASAERNALLRPLGNRGRFSTRWHHKHTVRYRLRNRSRDRLLAMRVRPDRPEVPRQSEWTRRLDRFVRRYPEIPPPRRLGGRPPSQQSRLACQRPRDRRPSWVCLEPDLGSECRRMILVIASELARISDQDLDTAIRRVRCLRIQVHARAVATIGEDGKWRTGRQ